MDQQIFSWLYNLADKNQLLDWFLVFLAEYLIFILAIAAVILILKEKNWRRRAYFAALVTISIILSRGIFTELIQFYYHHPRPFVAMDFEPLIYHAATSSFPSGHMAFFSVVLAVWLINRRAGVWFFVGSILIGLGRVAVGVHWPSDILGGILVGALSFFITYYLLKLKGFTLDGKQASYQNQKS
ncbi:MAG: phosphatase PAP2 family protein [Candidatus Colwellbacteria bacterium]|nr:phosphatase PAP2 family protein [Candidatus Colwellbacteria bacterium]